MRGLKGKVAIVAGAAPGNIGAATAIRLAEEGMAVVAADLNEAGALVASDEASFSTGSEFIADGGSLLRPRAGRQLTRSKDEE